MQLRRQLPGSASAANASTPPLPPLPPAAAATVTPAAATATQAAAATAGPAAAPPAPTPPPATAGALAQVRAAAVLNTLKHPVTACSLSAQHAIAFQCLPCQRVPDLGTCDLQRQLGTCTSHPGTGSGYASPCITRTLHAATRTCYTWLLVWSANTFSLLPCHACAGTSSSSSDDSSSSSSDDEASSDSGAAKGARRPSKRQRQEEAPAAGRPTRRGSPQQQPPPRFEPEETRRYGSSRSPERHPHPQRYTRDGDRQHDSHRGASPAGAAERRHAPHQQAQPEREDAEHLQHGRAERRRSGSWGHDGGPAAAGAVDPGAADSPPRRWGYDNEYLGGRATDWSPPGARRGRVSSLVRKRSYTGEEDARAGAGAGRSRGQQRSPVGRNHDRSRSRSRGRYEQPPQQEPDRRAARQGRDMARNGRHSPEGSPVLRRGRGGASGGPSQAGARPQQPARSSSRSSSDQRSGSSGSSSSSSGNSGSSGSSGGSSSSSGDSERRGGRDRRHARGVLQRG